MEYWKATTVGLKLVMANTGQQKTLLVFRYLSFQRKFVNLSSATGYHWPVTTVLQTTKWTNNE